MPSCKRSNNKALGGNTTRVGFDLMEDLGPNL